MSPEELEFYQLIQLPPDHFRAKAFALAIIALAVTFLGCSYILNNPTTFMWGLP